jgi:hypothetical protein
VAALLSVSDGARGAGADAALDTTVVGVLYLFIVVVLIEVVIVVVVVIIIVSVGEAAAFLDNTGKGVAKDAVVAADS